MTFRVASTPVAIIAGKTPGNLTYPARLDTRMKLPVDSMFPPQYTLVWIAVAALVVVLAPAA